MAPTSADDCPVSPKQGTCCSNSVKSEADGIGAQVQYFQCMIRGGLVIVVFLGVCLVGCGAPDSEVLRQTPTPTDTPAEQEPQSMSSAAKPGEPVATLTIGGEGRTSPKALPTPSQSPRSEEPKESRSASVKPAKPVEPSPKEESADSCDPNYSGACVPIRPYDLDCPDIGQMVKVVGTDIHGFDRDRDGFGCESYG